MGVHFSIKCMSSSILKRVMSRGGSSIVILLNKNGGSDPLEAVKRRQVDAPALSYRQVVEQ